MDNWQPSTLSWSFSRRTHMDDCRRHYFYHRFWGQDPRTRWKFYEMRRITTLVMLRGSVAHQVIAESLSALRDGNPIALDAARERVTEIMREKLRESYYKLWHIDNCPHGRKPSEFTNVLEHYYRFPETEARARENRDVAVACVENLFQSELWAEIAATDPANWKTVEDDDFPSFDLDGIKVYATIDFAHSHDQPTIIDWKTGAPGDDDHLQLTLYALYAQWKWGWKPSETKLAAVYLQPDFMVKTFTPSGEDIDAATETVKQSFGEMLKLEPAFGPASIDDFPTSDDPNECRWCRFRGACEGAKRLQDA